MSAQLRILVVDDDQVDRLAVKRLLREARIDASVTERADRASALEAMREGAFDAVLLDYNLPGADGLSVLQELRRSGLATPIVALTGQGGEEIAVELMKAGAADYLNKNTLTAERLESSLRYARALHRAEEERRLLLLREQEARQQAQAANRAKDEFLATLSHELRTPLNAILGWSRLLASGHLDDANAKRAVEIIERNTRLQSQLIEDLLDISRIITGKLRLDLQAASVRAIVDAAIESVQPSAAAKNITLACDCAVDEHILCDPSRMQQVVWNLLSNAIKFTPQDGRVTVTVHRRGGNIVIAVADSGSGIHPDFLPYVFDRFRQQDGAITRAHGGLGLGLSIVRHLVELHGGSVVAASEGEGRGATFTVTVPVAPAAADQPEGVDAASGEGIGELPSLSGITVMVVDNEADARTLVCAVLEASGARVLAVESAADALALLKVEQPDVLLSDIAMPVEDGYALIRKVRRLPPPHRHVPAAALTAFATATDRARALLAGYQAHIPKPVEPSELAAVVAALAGRTVVRS
jgi:signal transduction histidine kinase